MTESALVPTVVDTPMDFTVIATSPTQMEGAQRSLILWAARKIQAIKGEIAEAQSQYDQCVARKWSPAAWRAQITKHEKNAEFYRKIKVALEAGYYIVPPFPIDIFAIRTKRQSPNRMDSTYSNNHDQNAEILPIGKGRYVDSRPRIANYVENEKKQDGSIRAVTHYYAEEFKGVDFPFKLAKVEIRDATEKAMKLGIFDDFGVLPRTRSADPIVCGRIIDPKGPSYSRGEHRRAATFFVAWWLD